MKTENPMATKQDLAELLARIEQRFDQMETGFATKQDLQTALQEHPTKSDLQTALQEHPTKSDLQTALQEHPTKSDLAAQLENYATRADVEEIIGQRVGEIVSDALDAIAERFDKVDSRLDRLEDKLDITIARVDMHDVDVRQLKRAVHLSLPCNQMTQ